MNRGLSIPALVIMSGLGVSLAARATPQPSMTSELQSAPSNQTGSNQTGSNQTRSTPSPDASVPQSQTDATTSQPSARAFEGKIEKSGDAFVLQEIITQNSYKLDDQSKAKKFEGKDVRVMATIDPESNELHVVDIERSDTR